MRSPVQIWLAAPKTLAHEHVFAAIAQPVERILGKDEVASSNLASSSKKERIPSGILSFLSLPRFEDLNAARMSAAGEGLTEPHNNSPPRIGEGNANKSG